MSHYFTEEQRKQVHRFVERFNENLDWLCSADGVDMLSDKATMDDGSISEAYMCQVLMMFAMDELKEVEDMDPEHMHNRIASAVLMWSRTMGNHEFRVALKPIFDEYLRN